MRLKGYPEEEVRKARKLVSSFIRSTEEVEEVICQTYFPSLFRVMVSADEGCSDSEEKIA